MKNWNISLFSGVTNHLVNYPTPINISYLWGSGSLTGFILIIQIITGVFLAIHYHADARFAFYSVEHIIRDVQGGWFIRYIHSNGASFFFIIVYIHIFRSLYYGSYIYPRHFLWCSGVITFLLIIGTAFIGYVLPWGQISYWAATVITNIVSVIPFIGDYLLIWVWGGFVVDDPTLVRFFSLHYFLPFLIVAISIIHLSLLHDTGSNNPLGVYTVNENLNFYPYFYVKDLFGFFVLLVCFITFIFFYPNYLGHPDNYVKVNPLQTPAHIVPEWYFLPFYGILRAIPHKAIGVVVILSSILILMLLPFINFSQSRSNIFKPFFKFSFFLFIFTCFILGWTGAQPYTDYPYREIAQLGTVFYFTYILILIPFMGYFERYLLRFLLLGK